MPGDSWQKFANIRNLYSFMFTHPGAKLLFMGCEFGQIAEWKFDGSLDWHLLENENHKGTQECVKKLNQLYKNYPALYQNQFNNECFQWINHNDGNKSIISFLRKSQHQTLLIVCNFTPVVHQNFRIGLPNDSEINAIFNSDDAFFMGSGVQNLNKIKTEAILWDDLPFSVLVNVPPLATVIFEVNKMKPKKKIKNL
jgi:1,4-alpha-glucan branching enzyme